jgi:hypothetical protein
MEASLRPVEGGWAVVFVELGRLVSTVLGRRATVLGRRALAEERVAMFAKDTEFELERLVADRAPFGRRATSSGPPGSA